MARPRPAWPVRVARRVGACEGVEGERAEVGGKPFAFVSDDDCDAGVGIAPFADRDGHGAAGRGVPNGVLHQVAQCAADVELVGGDVPRADGVQREVHASPIGDRCERLDRLVSDLCNRHGLASVRALARFDAGELDELIEQCLHVVQFVADHPEVSLRVGCDAVLQALYGCPHRRQRGAQVVPDAGEQHLPGRGQSFALVGGCLQRVHHVVDRSSGTAHLVLALDACSRGQVACRHLLGHVAQAGDVASERTGELRADDECDATRQHQYDQEQPVVV